MIPERELAAEPEGLVAWVRDALRRKWTGLMVRALAVALVYGALVHLGNIAGLSGRPWAENPLSWRVLDVTLLVFNVIVGFGLWRKRAWAVAAFVGGIVLLQIAPFTLFPSAFATTPEQADLIRGLVVTWLVLLAALLALIGYRK